MTISTENKRGSDCSGTDGTANRVLTLSNTMLTQSGGFNVFVNGLNLVPTTEYTPSHLSEDSTITLLNIVWDTDYIVVVYLQTGGTVISSKYATTSDVYNRSGLTSSLVSTAVMDMLIVDAEAELESITQNIYTDATAITEYFTFKRMDLLDNSQSKLMLTHWPIQSITSFTLLDIDGTVVSTFDTLSTAEILAATYQNDDYWIETMNNPIDNTTIPWGQISLKTKTFETGVDRAKVSYTYGYASVPRMITTLSACLAGIRGWVYLLGGNYESASSYSLDALSVQKGELFTRGQQMVASLQSQADSILDRIGRQPRVTFYASGGDR